MCGLGQVAAVILNLVSALTYLKEEAKQGKEVTDVEVPPRKSTSTRWWRLLYDSAVALMLFPPILLVAIQTTRPLWPWVFSCGPDVQWHVVTHIFPLSPLLLPTALSSSTVAALYPQVATWLPTVLVVTIFLSAPLSHISGVVKGKGYELWQPLKGGVHYVTAQALGWMICENMMRVDLLCYGFARAHGLVIPASFVPSVPCSVPSSVPSSLPPSLPSSTPQTPLPFSSPSHRRETTGHWPTFPSFRWPWCRRA